MSCLETDWVIGYKRVPEPPAKIMPLRLRADVLEEEVGCCIKVALAIKMNSGLLT